MSHLLGLVRLGALALAISPALASASSTPDVMEPISLKPNLTPGHESVVVVETSRTSTILPMGLPGEGAQEKSTAGSHTIEYLMKVASSDATGSVVTLRVEKIEMTAKTAKAEYNWKSTDARGKNDVDNQVLTTMRPALGATITISLDPLGNVTKVDNGGVQIVTSDLTDFVRLVVGPHEVRSRWSPVLSPRKGDYNVEVGQKWTGEEKLDVPRFGQFTNTTNYELKSASDAEAIIDLQGSYSLGAGPDGQTPMFRVKNSSVVGTIVWDRVGGLLKTAEINQRVELEGNAQGIPLGFRTETKVKFRREAKAAAEAAPK